MRLAIIDIGSGGGVYNGVGARRFEQRAKSLRIAKVQGVNRDKTLGILATG
jgi:hypothetical protein